MTIHEMRAVISDAYPGKQWKTRCKDMPSKQVCAIYYSIQSRDRYEQKKNSEKQQKQLTIFDFM